MEGTPKRQYLRDGRAPVPKTERTSAVMSRIRAKNTKPERMMREALGRAGIKGYRLNYAKAPGRPDIAFVGRRIAVFVHGCFWHSCPHCQRTRPKSNRVWWEKKLGRNVERDREKSNALRADGWRVITVWECLLKRSPDAQAKRVEKAIAQSR